MKNTATGLLTITVTGMGVLCGGRLPNGCSAP